MIGCYSLGFFGIFTGHFVSWWLRRSKVPLKWQQLFPMILRHVWSLSMDQRIATIQKFPNALVGIQISTNSELYWVWVGKSEQIILIRGGGAEPIQCSELFLTIQWHYNATAHAQNSVKGGSVNDKTHDETAAQPLFKGSAEHRRWGGSNLKKKYLKTNALLQKECCKVRTLAWGFNLPENSRKTMVWKINECQGSKNGRDKIIFKRSLNHMGARI